MRGALVTVLVALASVACSSSQPTFVLSNAVAESTHLCPAGASNAPYPLRVSVEAHNPTSSAVTVKAITATLKLEAAKGSWLEKIGETYDAGSAKFTPTTVAPGADRSLEVTVSSACTGATSLSAVSSYGDYLVTLQIETSVGAFRLSTTNRHRIVA